MTKMRIQYSAMQSATDCHVTPVQMAAKQARCTRTNGIADGYTMSLCSSSTRDSSIVVMSFLFSFLGSDGGPPFPDSTARLSISYRQPSAQEHGDGMGRLGGAAP